MPLQDKAVPLEANASSVSPEEEVSTTFSIEEFNLPKSIVTRLAKGVLPPNTQFRNHATLAISKSATLFVNYIASQANQHAVSSDRKTVQPNDVFAALEDCEFGSWRPRLEAELQKFTEIHGQRKEKLRTRANEDEPAKKRLKRDGGNDTATKNRDQLESEEDLPSDHGRNSDVDGDVASAAEENEEGAVINSEEEGEEEQEEEEEEEEEEEDPKEDRLGNPDDEEPSGTEDPTLNDTADEALDNGDDSD